MTNNDSELGPNEVNARLSKLISYMSEAKKRKLLKELEKLQQSKSEKKKHSIKSAHFFTDFADDERLHKQYKCWRTIYRNRSSITQ